MARRVDSNHAEIVAALRAAGATVVSLHESGGGVPDLLVGVAGVTMLFEVKRPGGAKLALQLCSRAKRKDKAKITSAEATAVRQERFRRDWLGGTVAIVESVEDALSYVYQLGVQRPEPAAT